MTPIQNAPRLRDQMERPEPSASREPLNLSGSEAERHRASFYRRRVVRYLLDDPVNLIALCILLTIFVGALGADIVSPYDPLEQDLRARLQPPSLTSTAGQPPHLLGTDQLGRDMLSRLLHGARVSLIVGLASVFISGSLGTLVGLLAGYYGGWVDDLVMRLVDLQMGFPNLLLALLVLYVAGPSFTNLVLVLSFTAWMLYTRIIRGMTLSLKAMPFVESSRAIGCRDRRIIFVYLLPNLVFPLLVLATLEVGTAILSEAALSFLGFGIRPPQASWGLMLAQGREYITTAWWLTVLPGLFILATVLSLNLLVTWVRTATDPAQSARLFGVGSKKEVQA